MVEASLTAGFIGRIPVRNLWLLMLYASDLFRELEGRSSGIEDNPDDIPDLVGEILAAEVERRFRRNLTYGYRSRSADLNRVRGRIDLLDTYRRQLLDRGKVACRFDELTVDTTRNRYVRAALEVLSKIVKSHALAHRCRSSAAVLAQCGVSAYRPTKSEISQERFGRNDAGDRAMVSAARLAFDLALPTEDPGSRQLPTPQREIAWVRRLFEKGVGGFYRTRLTQEGWTVEAGTSLNWQISQHTDGIPKILPSMRTDIVLQNLQHRKRVIIDTKFNALLTQGWYREASLRSGYVYQIYAYLRSQAGRGDPLADTATGILLHPSVGEEIFESAVIQGHEIRFATVDLTATAAIIANSLLRSIDTTTAPIFSQPTF